MIHWYNPKWIWITVRHRILARLRHLFRFREMFCNPYESCQRCGALYSVVGDWKDDVWIAVVGSENGLLCPSCFIELARLKGIAIKKSDVKLWIFQHDWTEP